MADQPREEAGNLEYCEMKNSKKGFTLIELVLVVAILAILAMIAIPTVKDMVENAKNSVAVSNIHTVDQFFNVALVEMDSSGQYVPVNPENKGISVMFSSFSDYIIPGGNVDEAYTALIREKVVSRVGKEIDFGYTVYYMRGTVNDPAHPEALTETLLLIYYYPDKNDLSRYYLYKNGVITPPRT